MQGDGPVGQRGTHRVHLVSGVAQLLEGISQGVVHLLDGIHHLAAVVGAQLVAVHADQVVQLAAASGAAAVVTHPHSGVGLE